MVVKPAIDARTLGLRYAQEIASEPGVQELWVDTHRDLVELWLLTDDLDDAAELRLDGATIVLHDEFPGTYWRFHLWSPRHFLPDTDYRAYVPASAKRIELHD